MEKHTQKQKPQFLKNLLQTLAISVIVASPILYSNSAIAQNKVSAIQTENQSRNFSSIPELKRVSFKNAPQYALTPSCSVFFGISKLTNTTISQNAQQQTINVLKNALSDPEIITCDTNTVGHTTIYILPQKKLPHTINTTEHAHALNYKYTITNPQGTQSTAIIMPSIDSTAHAGNQGATLSPLMATVIAKNELRENMLIRKANFNPHLTDTQSQDYISMWESEPMQQASILLDKAEFETARAYFTHNSIPESTLLSNSGLLSSHAYLSFRSKHFGTYFKSLHSQFASTQKETHGGMLYASSPQLQNNTQVQLFKKYITQSFTLKNVGLKPQFKEAKNPQSFSALTHVQF